MGHYAKDYYSIISNIWKPEKTSEKGKQARWNWNQAKAARSTTNFDDSDTKPYPTGRAFMTRLKNEESGI